MFMNPEDSSGIDGSGSTGMRRCFLAFRRLLARRGERGSISIAAAILVPAVIVMFGLVYDGNGKVTAARKADAAAVASARAGGDASTSKVAAGGSPGRSAAAAARASLAAQGVSGSVSVSGQTLTVRATETYSTAFLQIVGIGQLQGHGEATARVAEVTP